MDTREFLKTLYGGLSGYAVIGTKDQYGDLDTERVFALPRDLEENRIARYVELRSDQDVYCAVSSFSGMQRSKNDEGATTNVVWADADMADPSVFRMEPSIIVVTSQDRYHLFWVLNDAVDSRTAQEFSRRISVAHRDQGCDMGWTLTKYLRVPGTTNLKYSDPWTVIAESTGLTYSLSDFEEHYPSDEFDNDAVSGLDRDVPASIDSNELQNLESRIPIDLRHLYTDVPDNGTSWSERAMRLWCDLFRAGFEDYEVYHLALNASCNKYAPSAWGKLTETGVTIPKRNNWEDVTWKEVLKAKVRIEAERDMPAPVVLDNHVIFNTERPKFITDAERAFVAQTPLNFIQRYRTLGERFTGSAPVYHDQLAVMLLSCAFGNLGYINLPYLASRPLNVWGLILGDSTSSRKSTALQLALDTLKMMDEDGGTNTYIGSDVTAEGLTKALTGRNDQVSLVSVDEVSGLLSSMSSKKYQSGTQERFTELYDGRVPKTLRTSRDEVTDDIRTCFNFYGAGVRSRVKDALTVQDYQSGFLMRFTWAVDECKGYVEGSSSVRFQRNHPEINFNATAMGRMSAVQLLGEDLNARRSTIVGRNKKMFFDFDSAAEDRFNKWLIDAHRYVERSGIDFVHSAVERLGVSVMKLACLLRMYGAFDLRDMEIVPEETLIIALRQAENWMYDMLLVASEVTSSAFEEMLNSIERYVLEQPEHTATEVQMRRKFARYKPREFDELIKSLEMQGRIRFKADIRSYQALV